VFERFLCKYCGKEKPWEDRDYDMGLYLAKIASFEALGHMEGITPYPICKQCSEKAKNYVEVMALNKKDNPCLECYFDWKDYCDYNRRFSCLEKRRGHLLNLI